MPRPLRVSCALTVFLFAYMGVATVTTQSVGVPPSNGTDVVAVIPFDNISGAPGNDWIGAGIAETLMADLQDATTVDVIARDAVSEAMDTIGFTGAVPVGDAAVLEVGRRLGARWLVTGGYQRLGDQLRITGRLIEVRTATIVRTAKIDGALDDLFELQDRLAAQLVAGDAREAARVSPQPAPRARPTTPSFTDAAFDGPPQPVPPATISRDVAGRATIRAVRLTAPLQLDGQLDEALYTSVPSISDFIQAEPQAGAAATEKTEVWVSFDRDNVYVSFRCWESRPDRLVATEMRRDGSAIFGGDDSALFMFDTFYDRRNSVNFTVNPLGGRMDGQVANESQYSGDWNPIWNVRTGRFEGGWTVEAAVPFKSLRYRPGRAQMWGFNARRFNRWKNELSYVTRIPAARANTGHQLASLAATLVGLEAPAGSRNLEVKPYTTANLTSDVIATPPTSNALGSDVGVDVKYGITQNLTTDFTYNTDFAQVEADEQQVNLTRFSLFFPEKREFFLENQGLFGFGGVPVTRAAGDVPILFYSRRIGLHQGRRVPIPGWWAPDRAAGSVQPRSTEHSDRRRACVWRASDQFFGRASQA